MFSRMTTNDDGPTRREQRDRAHGYFTPHFELKGLGQLASPSELVNVPHVGGGVIFMLRSIP